MWGISLDFILPQWVTTSLYSSYPTLQMILTLKAKFVVAYSLGLLLLFLGAFSFIKTVANTHEGKIKMSLEWLCLILIIGMEFIWVKLPIYDQYNGIILVNFGIITSLIVCKVMISSVTKMKLEYFHK